MLSYLNNPRHNTLLQYPLTLRTSPRKGDQIRSTSVASDEALESGSLTLLGATLTITKPPSTTTERSECRICWVGGIRRLQWNRANTQPVDEAMPVQTHT